MPAADEGRSLTLYLELNLARAGAGDLLAEANGEEDDDADGEDNEPLATAKPAKKPRKKKM